MARIVLIRPGSTDYDEQGRIQGTLDIPLNEHGNAEVEQTIEQIRHLPIESLYCSECQAAEETASKIGAVLGLKPKQLQNMQNLDHGLWQGMLIDEVRRKQPKVYRQWQEQPDCICPPEGEMLSEARHRVQHAISRLLKKHRDSVVALVVPEPLASLVRCFLGCGELGNLWKTRGEREPWEVIEVGADHLAHSS